MACGVLPDKRGFFGSGYTERSGWETGRSETKRSEKNMSAKPWPPAPLEEFARSSQAFALLLPDHAALHIISSRFFLFCTARPPGQDVVETIMVRLGGERPLGSSGPLGRLAVLFDRTGTSGL